MIPQPPKNLTLQAQFQHSAEIMRQIKENPNFLWRYSCGCGSGSGCGSLSSEYEDHMGLTMCSYVGACLCLFGGGTDESRILYPPPRLNQVWGMGDCHHVTQVRN
eukprot:GHVU01115035.1.p1 GENE.GHVU01115035.1~~GHVU01115035.1.p1  ORF type:complete len:105 (-),score=2.37 GHVU01115035.1:75-389(-)